MTESDIRAKPQHLEINLTNGTELVFGSNLRFTDGLISWLINQDVLKNIFPPLTRF